MDIQLYQIDEENYLVDFRNLGYRLQPAPVKGKAAIDPALGLNPLSPIVGDTPGPPFDRERGRAGSMSTVADESESGEPVPVEEIRKVYQQPGGGTGVASPFLFLDVRATSAVPVADRLADRLQAHRFARGRRELILPFESLSRLAQSRSSLYTSLTHRSSFQALACALLSCENTFGHVDSIAVPASARPGHPPRSRRRRAVALDRSPRARTAPRPVPRPSRRPSRRRRAEERTAGSCP